MTILFAPNKGGNWSFNYIGRIMAMYNEDISLANRWDTYDVKTQVDTPLCCDMHHETRR